MENFLKSIKNEEFLGAKKYLFSMKSSIEEIYTILGLISNVTLVGENGESVSFDLEGVYENLEKLNRLIDQYEERLNRMSAPRKFLILSSKESPFLYENVTFYGYSLGLENVKVVINNKTYTPELINGAFMLRHSFNKTGPYVVYAQATNDTQTVKSNTLTITVQKIPTAIVAFERTEPLRIEGHLIDYFGNYLPNKEITLQLEGEVTDTSTNENGTFIFDLRPLFEAKNATLTFLGDSNYRFASTTLLILPSKERLIIRLFFDKKKVRAKKSIQIAGNINGTEKAVPLEIYVDGEFKDTITAKRNFTIFLSLEEGEHSIYARFPGNDEFAESLSNVIEIQAVPYNYLQRVIIFVLFILFGLLGYKLLNRAPKETKAVALPKKEKLPSIEGKPDFIRSYRFLYRFFRKLYNLPKSTTPRELLRRFENENFVSELKRVTLLHEKVFYGKKRIKAREILEGIRYVANIIVGLFVREEV
jgi:hypothetical protein